MLTAVNTTEHIRVSEEIKDALDEQKRPGESYNDVLERLVGDRTEKRREAIREGAGAWKGTNAAEGARAARQKLDEELGPD
jgi:predicted CopG family antitoxin